MKQLTMVLPLAVLLAYCSGPNNTQTTEPEMETEISTTTSGEEASSTLANNTATNYDEIYRVNATGGSITPASGTVSVNDLNTDARLAVNVLPADSTDPMYLHWQRTNGQYWTWNMDYPGYERPVAGSYNTAINGNWQLVMTPELAASWRPDNSRSLWMRNSDTYLSASESFNTRTGTVEDDKTVTTRDSMHLSGAEGVVHTADVNSINYNAYNGNMYLMPRFNLYLDNGSFTGYTGCNNISGRVELSGTGIRFLNTEPSTSIECLGGFDDEALSALLRRVDAYAYVGDELQLLQGNQILLRFRKNGPDTSLQ